MSNQPPSLWSERLKSPLTWHYAGFSLVLILAVVLFVRFTLDWIATNSRSADALAGKQVELKAMDLQTAPLRGLDQRVQASRQQIQDFYQKRIPQNYSSFTTRIGDLQVKSGVRLSRVQDTQGPPGSDLTEISMDAGISGAYPDIMRFVNSIERDPMFFVIQTMQLTGQQGGMVNLRLRVSTWMRAEDAAASGLPVTPQLGEPKQGQEPSPAQGEPANSTAVPRGKEGE
jgi:type IV pilus assembly protein PilO